MSKEETFKKREINKLQIKLRLPLEEIKRAIIKAMGLELTGTFQACKDCALGQIKKAGVIKTAIVQEINEKGYVDMCSLSTVSMGSKKHWLLIVEENINHAWNIFLQGESELTDAMMTLSYANNVEFKVMHADILCFMEEADIKSLHS